MDINSTCACRKGDGTQKRLASNSWSRLKMFVDCGTTHNPARTRGQSAGVQFPTGTWLPHRRLPPQGLANPDHSSGDMGMVGGTRPPCSSASNDCCDTVHKNVSYRNRTKPQSSNKNGTGNTPSRKQQQHGQESRVNEDTLGQKSSQSVPQHHTHTHTHVCTLNSR